MKIEHIQSAARAWPLVRPLLTPLLGVLLVSGICKSLELSGLVRPRPGRSPEEVVVQHQRSAASQRSNANLLFIGDSTCLMDLDLSVVSRPSGPLRPLNLGMLSIIPLPDFAELAAEFARKNPSQLVAIVLLVSPSMLEQETVKPNPANSMAPPSSFLDWTGLRTFRDLIQGSVPTVLPGRYGRFYGLDVGLDKFMQTHHGSAVDPGELGRTTKSPRPIEIKKSFRDQCALFRSKLPPNCPLLVGLAPVPKEQYGSDFPLRQEALASELKELVGAEKVLRLRASYPLILFASPTHLREQAKKMFTRQLWKTVLDSLNE